jgi:hypothetical protein
MLVACVLETVPANFRSVLPEVILIITSVNPAYVLLGGIIYLPTLRLIKAVQAHDIELIHKYLGTRLGFVSKVLGVVLVAE